MQAAIFHLRRLHLLLEACPQLAHDYSLDQIHYLSQSMFLMDQLHARKSRNLVGHVALLGMDFENFRIPTKNQEKPE